MYFDQELVETKTGVKVTIGLDLCQVAKNMTLKENTNVALVSLDVCKGHCSQHLSELSNAIICQCHIFSSWLCSMWPNSS